MPATIVVGGQFGSEGKGKVAHFVVRERQAAVAIRVGGPNSGHTVYDNHGRKHVFQQLPTAAIEQNVLCAIGPGSYIDPDILLSEVASAGLDENRLAIDPNAFVISDAHKRRERDLGLGDSIGSTLSGTGEAVVDRVQRQSSDGLAKNHPLLSAFTGRGPLRSVLRSKLDRGERVVVEGTQGFGLSLLQSPYYPRATARDTTAASFAAEAALSPRDVDEVIVVIRAFPIRVAGDSGPLPEEIDWQTVRREGSWSSELSELTTVTRRVRRVARFTPEIVVQAIEANQPTAIVLNHVDYFDEAAAKGMITSNANEAIHSIERSIARRIDFVGLGPSILLPRRSVDRAALPVLDHHAA